MMERGDVDSFMGCEVERERGGICALLEENNYFIESRVGFFWRVDMG